MKLFRQDHSSLSDAQKRSYARFEIAHTLVDFLAALFFLIGSVMFFYDSLQYAGTWLFVIGSLLFAAKPTLRLCREVHLYRTGEIDELAGRDKD